MCPHEKEALNLKGSQSDVDDKSSEAQEILLVFSIFTTTTNFLTVLLHHKNMRLFANTK